MSLVIREARAVSQGGGMPGEYMGDPGIFGGLAGALKGAIRGGIAGATGGILGGRAGAMRTREERARMGVPTMGVPMGLAPRGRGPGVTRQQRRAGVGAMRTAGIGGAVARLLPGGETGYEVAQVACPSGFHANKSDYFLRDGTFVPKGSKCVRNRRRNPLNPKAASRAISRIKSAKNAAKMLSNVTIRKKC